VKTLVFAILIRHMQHTVQCHTGGPSIRGEEENH